MSVAKKLAPVILPAAGTFLLPGVGTALGSALGAGAAFAPAIGGSVLGGAGGLISGGGLKSALMGAAGGGLAGGAANLAGAAGLTGAGSTSALQGALTGAGLGLASGSPKNALLGAALGGVGGFATGGGLGTAAGSTLDAATGTAELQGPTQGSGLMGALTKGLSSVGINAGGGASAISGGGNGMGLGFGDMLRMGAGIYNYGATQDTNKKIQQMLQESQRNAMNQLGPYQAAGEKALGSLSAGFSPGDLTQDPGYQFQLSEGRKALDNALSAQGMSQSGSALKRAMEYSQGLADQTYNQAYNRWLQTQQPLASMGYGAAGNVADLYGDIGGIGALTTSANQQAQNELLASLFGGGESSLQRILSGSGIMI